MAELSIFVDESGDFGDCEPHSPFYLMTLVFHDQSRDISRQVGHLKRQVVEAGFGRGHAIHSGPLIRREKDYKHLALPERRKLEGPGLGRSEEVFFHGARTLHKNYLKPMKRKEAFFRP